MISIEAETCCWFLNAADVPRGTFVAVANLQLSVLETPQRSTWNVVLERVGLECWGSDLASELPASNTLICSTWNTFSYRRKIRPSAHVSFGDQYGLNVTIYHFDP
jgi:hypothetical protein